MNLKLIQSIKEVSHPFHKQEGIDALLSKIKDESFVPLGESSHGTLEFYKIRAELTKKLITEKGFTRLRGIGQLVKKLIGILKVLITSIQMPEKF